MKVNVKATITAVIVLVILTILPFIGLRILPLELQRIFLTQSGLDILGLVNRVAVVGVVLSALILLRGHMDKATGKYLAVSSAWKIFWLFFVFFLLGAGYPETLGQAVLGGKAGPAENIVVFDFRLFALMATVIVAVMIARSVIQFQDTKSAQDSFTETNKVKT